MVAYLGYLAVAGIQVPLFYKKDELGKWQFNSQMYAFICCIELILLAGIRGYTVGADTATYLNAVEYYGSMPLIDRLFATLVSPFDFEGGYFLLTKFCAFLNLGKTGFLLVVAFLIYIPLFVTIQKHSSIPYFSILAYFAFGLFSYSLGIFRQMIAISILLCGWRFVRERKLFKYLLVVLLAMMFHTTAIISILLYFLYGINWRKFVLLIIPAELLMMAFGRGIVMIAFRFFPKYAGYIGGRYDVSGGSYIMLIILNVILFACIILDKKSRFCDDMTICALILAVMVQSLGYSMAIFGRVVPYFSIYLIIAIPDIIHGAGKKWKLPVGIAAACVLILLTVREFNGNQYVTPYYTFLTDIF